MANMKRPIPKTSADPAVAEAFIKGAPDAGQATSASSAPVKIKTAGKKNIITVSIDPGVLAKLDAWAAGRGMSRAAAISFAVSSLQ